MAIKARAMRELRRATTVALRDRRTLDAMRQQSAQNMYRLRKALDVCADQSQADGPLSVYLNARRRELLNEESKEHSSVSSQVAELHALLNGK